jgi:hypothetical protein
MGFISSNRKEKGWVGENLELLPIDGDREHAYIRGMLEVGSVLDGKVGESLRESTLQMPL